MWAQIIEIWDLVPMFEVMLTVLFFMVGDDDKFLAFVLGKFALQLELLLCEVEGFADRCLGVYAGQVE